MLNGIKSKFRKFSRKVRDASQIGVTGVFVLTQLLFPFLAVQPVHAADGGYTVELDSPTPPNSSTTYKWEIDGSKPGSGEEISHVNITGCWLREDIESVVAVNKDSQSQSIEIFDGTGGSGNPDGLVKIDGLNDGDLPTTVTIVFKSSYPSTGVANFFIKTGGGSNAGTDLVAAGPSCEPQETETGSITIIKNAIPDSDQIFEFVTTGLSTDATGFSLVDDDTPGEPEKLFDDLDEGTYVITENDTNGWQLDGISCTQGADVDKNGSTVTINLSEGKDVTCTFTNRQEEQVDFCDTEAIKSGSIKSWIEKNGRAHGGECFDYTFSQSCGVAEGMVTKQAMPYYKINGSESPYVLVWNEGSQIDLNNAKNFPATFDDDYNNGSVQITYYIVGPEGDWLVGSGLPNFWDNNGITVTVNTDCEKELPKVIVVKQTDPHKSDDKFEFIIWNNRDVADFFKLDTNPKTYKTKSYHMTEVQPGSVSVFEKPDKDWMTKFYCKVIGGNNGPSIQQFNGHDYEYGNWAKGFELDYGQTLFCKFVNTQKAEIEVVKYEDTDRDGRFDWYKEPTLKGWKMFLDKQNDCKPDYNNPFSRSSNCPQNSYGFWNFCWGHDYCDTTNHKGEAEFDKLKPYQKYVLSESEKQLKDGWNLSDIDCFVKSHRGLKKIGKLADYNQYELYLKPGAEVKCFVGNYRDVELIIDKSNDAIDALLPGQSVEFTITVSIPEGFSPLVDARVYDLMPKGLTYVNGSAEVDGAAAVLSPGYGSDDPAVWHIGDLEPGKTKVLTYSATVDEDTAPGTYTNVAWTDACLSDSRSEECEREVIGNTSQECLKQENCNPFVDSSVTVAAVLGESDVRVLAVTGAPAVLMPVAGLTIAGIALATVVPNRKWRRLFGKFAGFSRSAAMSLMALVLSVNMLASVSAAGFARLTVADLADETSQSSLELPYSVAQTDNSGYTVDLEVDGPGSNDMTDQDVDSGSKSKSFAINLPVDGSYTISVSLNGGTPDVQTVTRDATGPVVASADNVTVIRNGNQWTITFTIPGSSDADKVLVFSSTNSSFTANDDTKIGEVDATPGTEQSFVYDAPDGDQRYFALIAVDEAGNRTTITPNSVGVEGVVGGQVGVVDDGAVTDSNEASDDEGQEQAATDENGDSETDEEDSSNLLITVIVLAGLAGLLYNYFVRKPNESSN